MPRHLSVFSKAVSLMHLSSGSSCLLFTRTPLPDHPHFETSPQQEPCPQPLLPLYPSAHTFLTATGYCAKSSLSPSTAPEPPPVQIFDTRDDLTLALYYSSFLMVSLHGMLSGPGSSLGLFLCCWSQGETPRIAILLLECQF